MVKKQYACCPLEKFGIIVGWTSLILSVLAALMIYFGFNDLITNVYLHKHQGIHDIWVTATVSLNVSSILLILGIKTKATSFLIPWLVIVATIDMVLMGFYTLTVIIHIYEMDLRIAIMILAGIFCGLIVLYAWYGIFCLYQKITAEKKATEEMEHMGVENNADNFVEYCQ